MGYTIYILKAQKNLNKKHIMLTFNLMNIMHRPYYAVQFIDAQTAQQHDAEFKNENKKKISSHRNIMSQEQQINALEL